MPEPLRFLIEEETFIIYYRLSPTSSHLHDSDRVITIKSPALLSYHISLLSLSSLKCYILQKITLFLKKKEKASANQNRLFCGIKSDNVFVFHPIRYSNVARNAVGKKMPQTVLNPTTQNLSENMEEKLVRLEEKIREGKKDFQAI